MYSIFYIFLFSIQFLPANWYPIWSIFWTLYHTSWVLHWIVTGKPRNLAFMTNWGYILLVAYHWTDTAVMAYIYLKKKNIIQGIVYSLYINIGVQLYGYKIREFDTKSILNIFQNSVKNENVFKNCPDVLFIL